MSQLLYLEQDEEITTLVDRLRAAEDLEVVMVLPERSSVLHSRLNLKLLQHYANRWLKRVVLVTADPVTAEHANTLGVPVHTSVEGWKQVLADRPWLGDAPLATSRPAAAALPAERDLGNGGDVPPEPAVGRFSAAAQRWIRPVDGALPAEAGEEDEAPYAPAAPAPAREAPFARPVARRSLMGAPGLALRPPSLDTLPGAGRIWYGLLGAGLLMLLLALAVVALPQATITLAVASQTVSRNVTISGAPSGSSGGGAAAGNISVPTAYVQAPLSASASAPATGTATVGDQSAGGTVTLYNTTSSDVPVPSGTPVQTSQGTSFHTTQSVTVPAATSSLSGTTNGQADVAIGADQPGTGWNVPAGTINSVAGFSGLLVNDQAATTGGTDKTMKVVSSADIDQAVAQAKAQLKSQGSGALGPQLPAGFKLMPETVAVNTGDAQPNHQSGDKAESVTVTISGTVSGVGLNLDQLRQAMAQDLASQLPSSLNLLPGTVQTHFSVVSSDGQGSVTLSGAETGKAAPRFDADAIGRAVSGRSPESALAYLARLHGVKGKATIDALPPLPFLPFLSGNIHVHLISPGS